MNTVTIRPKPDRRQIARPAVGPDRFGLQLSPPSTRGERFSISIEGAGRFAESSKPMNEADARKVLHKTGHVNIAIDRMVISAKAATENRTGERVCAQAAAPPGSAGSV
jgi:hypothetical protein